MLAKRIIPCLDVKDGRVVKGINFLGLQDVGDAVELGRRYALEGADELVYLDISATLEGRKTFAELVARVGEAVNIPFTVGGGIRSLDDASRLLDAGADKITLNSAAIARPELIGEIAAKYGRQFVVVAIDAKTCPDGLWHATTHGGSRPSDKELFSWAKEAEERGAGEILFTSMDHDGTRNGYPCPVYAELSDSLGIPVIASGGAGSVEDIAASASSPKPAFPFAYKRLTVMTFDDFNLSKTGDGLLPVIIQDATTLKVLMLGYMDRAAFDKTVAEGRVTFFSRSKQRLWTKGETSGNFLTVKKMFADCDGDTLLIQADPAGPTCHRGTTACFDTPEDEGFIRSLSKLIQGRHAQMPDGSYTTKLFIKGPKAIAKKVGEEATEMVIEAVDGNRDRFIYETSDLAYHLLVLLESMGCTVEDIERELALRHR